MKAITRKAANKAKYTPPDKLATKIAEQKLLPVINKWYKKALKFDICRSDVVIKQRGNKQRINRHRREVLNELMRAVITTHDLLTGLLPKSSITSFSDQLNVSTFGQATYKNGVKLENGEKGGKKKKSISRISRGMKMAQEWGLLDVEYLFDPITGTYLPSIIQITARGYQAYGIGAEEVENAKRQRLGYMNLKETYGNPLIFEDLTELAQLKRRELRKERIAFRSKVRLQRKVKAMSNDELHEKAQRIVVSMFDDAQLTDMPDENFVALVALEKTNLLNHAHHAPPTAY